MLFFFLTPRIVEKIQEETNRRFWDSWQVLSCSASKVKSFSKCFGYLAALRHPRWVEPCWIMPWEPRTPLPPHPPTWGSFLVGSTCHGLMPKLSSVLLHWGERSNNLFLMWSCCIRHCKATHRFNVNPKKKKVKHNMQPVCQSSLFLHFGSWSQWFQEEKKIHKISWKCSLVEPLVAPCQIGCLYFILLEQHSSSSSSSNEQ